MDKNDLKEIINKFASQNVIFSNEQDFQFRLAIELRNYGYVVEVEKLSIGQPWSCFGTNLPTKLPEKEYTDIVVKDKNGQYTAIELKYATPSKVCYYDMKPNPVITVQQGGYTYRRYWYINDIMRLENINNKFGKLGQNQITNSFAIMLSNDSSYYNKDPRKIWKNYSIKDGSCLGGLLMFDINGKGQDKYKTGKQTFSAINLKGQYNLKWEKYELDWYQSGQNKYNKKTCPEFKYLIVEIDNNNIGNKQHQINSGCE